MNRTTNPVRHKLSLTLAALTLTFTCFAQNCPAQDRPAHPEDNYPVKYFHLANTAIPSEANEIMVAVRNMVSPSLKVYLVQTLDEIVISGNPEQIARAGEVIAELDRPRKTYRLTFTMNESDNGKRIGVQHFTFTTVAGQRAVLKQGDKVPLVTGSTTDQSAPQNQVSYVDVGFNLDLTLTEVARGLNLQSTIEQTAVTPGSTATKLPDDPIIRQSKLQGATVIPLGKPTTLGSLDVLGSTRHLDIEVLAEPLP